VTRLALLLRQPMLHFLAGGALLFLLYGLVGGETRGSDRDVARLPEVGGHIVITRGQVDSLASGFAARWRRPPNEAELAELIAEHVREEALVRQALALGLDRDDAVIRRQLRLKMEFIAQDVGTLGEPTEEELRALLSAQAERFTAPPRITFRHVFLDGARRGEAAARREAARLLEELNGPGGDDLAEAAGDRFLPGYAFRAMPVPEIGRNFGGDLAAGLQAAPVGRWSGPLASAYGLHLVRVEALSEAVLPALDEVRPALRTEWLAQRRREALDRFVAGLVAGRVVTIEGATQGGASTR
jgi:parvulin-like peptidyl-prolyl isomerase